MMIMISFERCKYAIQATISAEACRFEIRVNSLLNIAIVQLQSVIMDSHH